jgi:hypothetical protein
MYFVHKSHEFGERIMKRKLILLAIIFVLALLVALPVVISGDNGVTSVGKGITLARLVDFHKVKLNDPQCPPAGTPNSGGC